MRIATALKRATRSLPPSWQHTIRKHYTAYTVRTGAPPPEMAVLTPLISPRSLVIDAGANIGTFTVAFARAVPSAHVLSIEPIATTRALLTHTIRRCRLTNVTVLPWAVSDRAAEVIMEIPEEGGLPVLALARIKYRAADVPPLRTHVTIHTTRLDNLVTDARPVSLLKCDVEMHELEALTGALGVIRRDQPAVYAELQPDFLTKASQRSTVIALLAAEGYCAHEVRDQRLHPAGNALDVLFLTTKHLAHLRHHGVA